MSESESKKCPKCDGEMIQGSKENLERNFACTRGEPHPEVPQLVKVQSYYCKTVAISSFTERLKKKALSHEFWNK